MYNFLVNLTPTSPPETRFSLRKILIRIMFLGENSRREKVTKCQEKFVTFLPQMFPR